VRKSERATSKTLSAIWENVYGLLVDDGSLALGALGAVAITWLFAVLAPDAADQLGGGLLLALVCALVLTNLYLAGQRIRRAR
jgi:hypothetical protein